MHDTPSRPDHTALEQTVIFLAAIYSKKATYATISGAMAAMSSQASLSRNLYWVEEPGSGISGWATAQQQTKTVKSEDQIMSGVPRSFGDEVQPLWDVSGGELEDAEAVYGQSREEIHNMMRYSITGSMRRQ